MRYLPIIKAEKDSWNKHLALSFISNFELEEREILDRVLREISNYEVFKGKFYKSKEDLKKQKELKNGIVYFRHPVSGVYREAIILKKLIHSSYINHIYEIRMSEEKFEHRILVFIFDKETVETPSTIFTYGFNKINLSREKGNLLTDTLRDSSQRIRNEVYKQDNMIQKYVSDII